MADRTKIANLILVKVGSQRINDYLSDKEQARKVRDVFDLLLEQFLDEGNWTSHWKEQSIAQLVDTPLQKFDYKYQLPSDFLKPVLFNKVDVYDLDKTELFDIHGLNLHTDEDSVNLTYIENSTDETKLTPSMVAAFATLVASEVAISLRQDEALAGQLKAEYRNVLLPRARQISGHRRRDRIWNPAGDSRLVKARRVDSQDL